jgi:hypothetical protein
MAEYRNRDSRDQFGLDVEEGLGFSFNRSGVREFIRADREGVVTHRLFIYQNGSSPGQIVLDEGETLMDGSPLLTPVWQELGNAPERRGLGAAPAAYPQSASGSAAGAAGGGAGGGHRSLRRSVAAGPPVLARGPPVLARGPPVLAREQSQIAGTPLIARRQMQIPGTPVLAEDPRHHRNRTRKIKH